VQDSLKILETVNSFYSSSFSQLINITVAVLAFAGIVLPILITIYQKRLFKLDHEVIEDSLTKKIDEKFENAVEEVRKEYQEKEKGFEAQIEIMKKELHKEVDEAKGGISHVSGCSDLERNYYSSAFDSFIAASFSYIKAGNNLNLRRVINLISESCLPNMNKVDVEYYGDTFKRFEGLLEQLTEYDSAGIYTDQLKALQYQFTQCKKREPVAT